MSAEAKTTKAYKVSPELKEKLERLASESGLETQEAFIEQLAALYELQRLKEGNGSGYRKQIEELEYHLSRPLALFTSMINTEAAERLQLSQQHEEKITVAAGEVFAQQEEITDLKKSAKVQVDELSRITKESEAQAKQLEQLQEISRKDNLLVDEYKQKVDTLSGLVNDYKAAAEENYSLKVKVSEFTSLTDKQADRITALENDLKVMNELRAEQLRQMEERHQHESALSLQRHENEKERITEKADTQRERELLALRTEMQNKSAEASERYTAEIRDLYARIEEQRKSHEQYVTGLRGALEADIKSQRESFERELRELRKAKE